MLSTLDYALDSPLFIEPPSPQHYGHRNLDILLRELFKYDYEVDELEKEVRSALLQQSATE